jgi:hypothetical protein
MALSTFLSSTTAMVVVTYKVVPGSKEEVAAAIQYRVVRRSTAEVDQEEEAVGRV